MLPWTDVFGLLVLLILSFGWLLRLPGAESCQSQKRNELNDGQDNECGPLSVSLEESAAPAIRKYLGLCIAETAELLGIPRKG